MIHCNEIIVRGYHLDLYGHVNNARYLEFLEEARWSLLDGRLNLHEWQRQGRAFIIVNININYRYPAGLGDILTLQAELKRIGDRSAVIHQQVLLRGTDTVVVDADVTFVIADVSTGKALPLSGELREALDVLQVKELSYEQ